VTKCLDASPATRDIKWTGDYDSMYEACGKRLAELWLAERHEWIDFWGFDWWSEGTIKTFLREVAAAGALDELPPLTQWCYFCETGGDLWPDYKWAADQMREWMEEFR
jgi:hypothetical protein